MCLIFLLFRDSKPISHFRWYQWHKKFFWRKLQQFRFPKSSKCFNGFHNVIFLYSHFSIHIKKFMVLFSSIQMRLKKILVHCCNLLNCFISLPINHKDIFFLQHPRSTQTFRTFSSTTMPKVAPRSWRNWTPRWPSTSRS